MYNIGFIGTGNMGSAIIKGVLGSELSQKVSVFATDTDKEKLKALDENGVTALDNAQEICKKCSYIVLAVKPQVFDVVLDSIRDYVTKDTVIVSIAAGITAEYIQKKTISDAKVILVMPNTPLLLSEGATALSKSANTSDEEFRIICDIFASCGVIEVIDISKMKEIIAVNGSSPAFIYLFAKGFVDYAVKEGIDGKAALNLFAQSLVGSAKMLTDSGYSIDELIKMVSSPGGTTLKGLDELYKGDLEGIVSKCCESCTNRAYELSK